MIGKNSRRHGSVLFTVSLLIFLMSWPSVTVAQTAAGADPATGTASDKYAAPGAPLPKDPNKPPLGAPVQKPPLDKPVPKPPLDKPIAKPLDKPIEKPAILPPVTKLPDGRTKDYPNPQFTSPDTSGAKSVGATIREVDQLPAMGKMSPEHVREMVGEKNTAAAVHAAPPPAAGGDKAMSSPARTAGADAAPSGDEVTRLRNVFNIDFSRYDEYRRANNKALAIQTAMKWKAFGHLFPDKIEEITGNIAQNSGFPNFQAWIEDWIRKANQ